MSQVMSTIKQFASKLYKPGESTSSRPGWMVRDSHLTNGGLRMTNTTAGTFTGLILFIAFFCLPALLGANVSATASNIGITISGSPSVDIKSTPSGTFADSGNSTITITTNHASGYTLTAKAVNATSLAGTKGGNLVTLDSGTAINADTFSNASNTQYNDKWGYKPSKYNSIDNTTSSTSFYYPSPGLDTASSPLDTLDTTTNSSSSPYTYTVSIGARVSTATTIDSYSNSFVFAVVGNPTPYAITYNKNTTDTVSNMPANHTTSDTGAAGETVTLASNTPTRTGYSFNGWCTTIPTTSGGIDSCSGTRYTAGSTWTINQTSTTNSLNLYAMWNRNSYNVKVNFAGSGVSSVSFTASGYTTRTVSASGGTASLMYGVRYTTTMNFSSGNEFSSWALNSSSYGTLSSTSTNPTYFTPNTSSGSAIITATGKVSWDGYMQNMPASQCTTTARNATDNRDNNTYKVQRLADGKCWMLDNLRLDLTNSTILNSLTTTNTHVDSTSLTSLKSGNRSAGAQYASSGFATWNSSSSSNVFNQAKANADYKDTTTTTYGAGSGKIGVYYNYCAASAGSYCYNSGTPSSDPDTSTLQDAKYDLCPAGWRMPTSTTNGEYQALYTAYSSNATNFRNALSTPLSGSFYDGSAHSQGSAGYFWSSTYYNGYNGLFVYDLNVNSSNVGPSEFGGRTLGDSLRCILSS